MIIFALVVIITAICIWTTVYYSSKASIDQSIDNAQYQFQYRAEEFLHGIMNQGPFVQKILSDIFTNEWLRNVPYYQHIASLSQHLRLRQLFYAMTKHLYVSVVVYGIAREQILIGIERSSQGNYTALFAHNNTLYSYSIGKIIILWLP
jgi:hypothetical protein